MTFSKRVLIWGICIFSALIAIYLYLFVRLPFSRPDVFEAIPNSSPLIVEWNHTEELNEWLANCKINNKFNQVFFADKIASDLDTLDQLFGNLPFWKVAKTTGHWAASANSSSGNDWNLLYIVNLRDYDFKMESVTNSQLLSVSYNRYLGEQLYNVSNNKNESFYFSTLNGLLLFAKYPLMVEDAIRQLKTPNTNICREGDFNSLNEQEVAPQSVNIFLQGKQLPLLLSSFVKADRRNTLDHIPELASWGKLNLSFKKNEIASTLRIVPAAKNYFLSSIDKDNLLDLQELEEVVPNNTAMACSFGINDFYKFYKAVSEEENDFWTRALLKEIGNQFTYLITEPYSENLDTEKFIAFKLKNPKTVVSYLDQFASKEGKLKDYNYQSFRIGRLMVKNILSPILGKNMNDIQNPYYVIINNYLIFANSQAAIEVWVDKFVVNQTLSNDVHYQQFKSHQESTGALFFYVNTNYILPWIESYLMPEYHGDITKVHEQINAINHIGFRSDVQQRNVFKGNFQLSKNLDKPTTLVWKAKLAAPVKTTPQVLPLDNNGTLGIWVQDTLHQLYLINNEGNILWKRNMREPILSTIYPVDYYNNGQTYFMFNTTGHIYLVDNAGQDINSFPINLQSPATSGMLVTDFDKSRDYTLYVSCKNTNIYGYDKNGKPLEGWNPRIGMGNVIGQIRHFQKDNKDFILVQNKENQLFLLKRNGGLRTEPIQLEGNGFSLFEYQAQDKNERIAICDNVGKAWVCNFDGLGFNMYFKVGNGENIKFCFADVTGDAKYDYIVLSNNSVASFTYKNDLIDNVYEKTLTYPQDEIFAVTIPGQKKSQIGLVSKSRKQITLLEEYGQITKSFPLAGTTKFSISKLFVDGSNAVVTGYDNYVYVYRL